MDYEKLIQDYLNNKSTDLEKKTVEKLLQTDADFKIAFQEHKDVRTAFKMNEEKDLKSIFQNLEREKYNNTGKGKFYKKYLFAAIASIVTIVFLLNTNRSESGEDLFNSNFTVYPNTYQPVTRNEEEGVNIEAFVAYENNDFESSQKAFEALLSSEKNLNHQFYYALSLLNQSKFNLALVQFNEVSIHDSDYKAESIWYTSLIYLHQEKFSDAQEKLEALKEIDSTFKAEERENLLEKLK